MKPIIYIAPNSEFSARIVDANQQSQIPNYTDDTSSGCKGKNATEVLEKLEENAANILEFLASNELVAYAAKTEFMMIMQLVLI